MEILLDGDTLTLEEVGLVAAGQARASLAPGVRDKLRASRAVIERVAENDEPVYGVNTGFGTLAEVRIPRAQLRQLQKNLVRSHATGVGPLLSREEVRAMLALRANALAKGMSGVREEVVDLVLAMLQKDLLPAVPSRGSVGASGDLAPLAHAALALIGEGETLDGRATADAMRDAGLTPLSLEAKEGLALINGTQAMTAVGTLALLDAERTARAADIAAAMTVEGLLGSHRPFRPEVQAARPHPGQERVAANLRALLHDSEINRSHQEHCDKVQDPYSLRCVPQVHGAARDGLQFCRAALAREINAATDNPLVFAGSGEVVSQGNFHGQPIALALDLLAIAVTQLAGIAERRIEQLVNPALSGLPPFLAKNSGLNSGFMVAQVTAAALVAENRILSHPASVDTIPSSAGREDHVSMGMTAALKARDAARNARYAVAIELMCAAQALDFRRPLKAGRGAEAAWKALRAAIPTLDEDRALHRDIETAARLVETGALERAVIESGSEIR